MKVLVKTTDVVEVLNVVDDMQVLTEGNLKKSADVYKMTTNPGQISPDSMLASTDLKNTSVDMALSEEIDDSLNIDENPTEIDVSAETKDVSEILCIVDKALLDNTHVFPEGTLHALRDPKLSTNVHKVVPESDKTSTESIHISTVPNELLAYVDKTLFEYKCELLNLSKCMDVSKVMETTDVVEVSDSVNRENTGNTLNGDKIRLDNTDAQIGVDEMLESIVEVPTDVAVDPEDVDHTIADMDSMGYSNRRDTSRDVNCVSAGVDKVSADVDDISIDVRKISYEIDKMQDLKVKMSACVDQVSKNVSALGNVDGSKEVEGHKMITNVLKMNANALLNISQSDMSRGSESIAQPDNPTTSKVSVTERRDCTLANVTRNMLVQFGSPLYSYVNMSTGMVKISNSTIPSTNRSTPSSTAATTSVSTARVTHPIVAFLATPMSSSTAAPLRLPRVIFSTASSTVTAEAASGARSTAATAVTPTAVSSVAPMAVASSVVPGAESPGEARVAIAVF